jgi:putative addiction module CopG family antidote
MGTMNVSLPDDLIEFVKSQTNGGGYGNQSAVVADGLRRLRTAQEKRAVLVAALRAGRADVTAGRTEPLTDELLRDIAERARKSVKAPRRAT